MLSLQSAASPTTAQPDQSLSSPHPPSQNAHNLANGAIGDGAVHGPDALASNQDVGQPPNNNDAIREGKEKAKAVMAAAGVSDGTSAEQKSNGPARTSPPAAAEQINGASPSRKRSRSGSRIPAQSAPTREVDEEAQAERQKHLLNDYTMRDMLHADALNDQSAGVRELMREKRAEVDYYKEMRQRGKNDPASVFGFGYAGFGNGLTDARPSRLTYPADRRRPVHRRTRPIHVTRKNINRQADLLEELVPVRLDIEFEKIKLRDTFTWNLHENTISSRTFAEHLVEDFKVPPEMSAAMIAQVNREIDEQTTDFYPHCFIDEEPLDPHLPYFAYKNDEMRILIKLNITIGQHTLVDQFEWEINNPLNSPEQFARQMASDLSLSGEFTTAIAHSIREQCQMFSKSLYITGHPFDGRPVEDADVRDSFLPSPLPSTFRPAQSAKEYTPYLYELNEAELERAELSILREQRRQKRSTNRRGGPALPDLKDRQRSVRTLVVSSVLPGAAETPEESRLFKVTRAAGARGRRPGALRDDDSEEESEDEDSIPGSPAPSNLMVGGTARTRGMRGAATAAQAAMRANLGRSQTPEIASLHHHETRTSARSTRAGGFEGREESVAEPTSLLVRLKISREKYRKWNREQKAKAAAAAAQQNYLSTPQMTSQNGTPQQSSTPAGNTSMPPPPSPAPGARSTPTPSAATSSPQPPSSGVTQHGGWTYSPDGRADAPYPQPANPAPPPPWLVQAIADTRQRYPNDNFEASMRYTPIDKKTNTPIAPQQGVPLPPPGPTVKYQYLPRIRCFDCPGKLYTAGPPPTIENFEVHLKHRPHREKVEARRRSSGSGPPT